MNQLAAARTRLEQAQDLPGMLAAGYDAFQDMLQVVRCHEERDEGSFPAFVLSAAAAANGRDQIAAAPSLPPAPAATGRVPGAKGSQPEPSVTQVALALAGLSGLLAGQLTAAAADAADAGDRASCTNAARHAARIRSLLAGAREP